jgi:predicted nucleic acid-binding protein
MLHLILDTNIWIYIAEGEHPDITEFIIQKIYSNEIDILSNDVIIQEWERHKERSRDNAINRVQSQFNGTIGSSKFLRKCLPEDDKRVYDDLIAKFKLSESEALAQVDTRISRIDDIVKNRSTKTEINDQIKIEVISLALEKKAPFHNKKNNTADAIILLSTLKFLTDDQMGLETPNAIFVTNNIEDFSEGNQGESANRLHPDILELKGKYHLTFKRNAGEVLALAPKYIEEINRFWEYLDDRIIQEMEWQAEIMRGK